jgi:hypothetical protein
MGSYLKPNPYLMASLTQGDAADTIDRQGFITLEEPAIGVGAMVIASAEALLYVGINPQQSLHVTSLQTPPMSETASSQPKNSVS